MAQCMIFEEDEVSVETESGFHYALVVESSEFVSSDEDEEENTYWERVKRGTLRVALHPDGEEEIVPETQVKLVDRSLMPGDVVRRLIAGEDSQRGYVRNTVMQCYLQILGKPKVICDVDSRDLEFIEYWNSEPGDVYLDSWVGKVLKVSQLITLKFSDGARVEVEEEDFYTELSSYEDMHEKRDKDTEFAMNEFYPGQRLKGYLSDLQKVKWLVSTKQHSVETAKKAGDKEVIVIVEKVVPKSLEIHWLCQGFAKGEGRDKKTTAPSSNIGREDLKRLRKLDCFEATSVQLGDKMFYVLKESDILHNVPHKGNKTLVHHIKSKLLRQHSTSDIDKRNALNTLSKQEEGTEELPTTEEGDPESAETEDMEVESNNTQEQEGEGQDCLTEMSAPQIEEGEESHGPVIQEDDTEFQPYVTEEFISDNESVASGASTQSADSGPKKKRPLHKKGGALPTKILKKKKLKKSKRKEDIALWEFKPGDKVACEVIYTCSKVEVMWQDGTVEKDIPSTELYPIHHLDELEFFPGDYVIPSSNSDTSHLEYGVVSRVDHAGRTCMVTWFKSNERGLPETPVRSSLEEEVSVYDIKDHVDYKFRPGLVVVRVGGYERAESLVAAGQVSELGTDGRLLVHWADGSRSHCYPQEVYLLGEDMSELNSDLSSDLDTSELSGSEADSWETEEEEDVSSAEEGEAEQTVKNSPVKRLSDAAGKLLEVLVTSLQKLEELFSLPVVVFCPMKCFREVLKLYKSCRDVDRKLNASYFEDSKLRKVISMIKGELRKEQQKMISEKIQELVDRNMALRLGETKATDVEGKCSEPNAQEEEANRSTEKSSSDTENNQTMASIENSVIDSSGESSSQSDEKVEQGLSQGQTQGHSQNQKDGTSEAVSTTDSKAQAAEASAKSCDQDNGEKTDLECSGMDAKASNVTSLAALLQKLPDSLGSDVSVPELKSKLSQLLSTDLDMLNIGKLAEHIDQSTQTSGEPDCGKCTALSRELCQQACHLLREIVIKIQEEMGNKGKGDSDSSSNKDETNDNKEVQLSKSDNTTAMTVDTETISVSVSVTRDTLEKEGECEDIGTQKGDSVVTEDQGESEDKEAKKRKSCSPVKETEIKSGKSQSDGSGALHLDLCSPSESRPSDPLTPVTPQTPAEIREKLQFNKQGFSMLESVPSSHKFSSSSHRPNNMKTFTSSYRKELKLLHTSLPHGIFVKGFEDRMDLFSVMIHGPKKTPYEDGLFFFDVKLPDDFPNSPPNVHYIAYCTDRLNPNLYEDGTVCVSLLGTWQGKGTEVWTKDSSLLQILISLQGLILVSEPYYNEAGYEKQKGSQQGQENSRMYNEMALLKMVQSVTKMAVNPPQVFETEVLAHLKLTADSMLQRLHQWLDDFPVISGPSASLNNSPQRESTPQTESQADTTSSPCQSDPLTTNTSPTLTTSTSLKSGHALPEFPLFPVSKGFTLTLRKNLIQLKKVCCTQGIMEEQKN